MPFKSCLGPKQLQIYLNIQTRLPQLTNAMLQMVYMLYKLTIYFINHNNNRQHKTHDIDLQCILNYIVIYYNQT